MPLGRKLPLIAVLALLGVTACLASLPTAETDSELRTNKTPKSAHLFTDACTECQAIIQKLAEVAGDPQKVMELKAILNLLCHETSYESECKLFVSRLDLFLEKLLPYLKDPHTVCHWMHICGNSRVEQFHRVGLLYAKKYVNRVQGAKDLVCEECQFAANELKQVVDDPTMQSEAKQWLSDNVCARMGQYRGACDTVLDEAMPEFWQELHDVLANPKQFCVDIDLCASATQSSNTSPRRRIAQATPTTTTQEPQTPVQNARTQQKVSKRLIQTIFPSEEVDEE
jgi:hypothetical protein